MMMYKTKKTVFFSIGVNYGFNHTTMSAGSGANSNPKPRGLGNFRGVQIEARVISLFKGDLSTSFGVTAFEGLTLHFF